jgi:hypothetical protein
MTPAGPEGEGPERRPPHIIIRLSLQLFLLVGIAMEHQWENVNLSQFIEFTKSHPTKNKLQTTHPRQQIRRQIRNLHDLLISDDIVAIWRNLLMAI